MKPEYSYTYRILSIFKGQREIFFDDEKKKYLHLIFNFIEISRECKYPDISLF